MFLMQDTIQWLNYVMRYLNVKINKKSLSKILRIFEVQSNESSCINVDFLGWNKSIVIIIKNT